MTYDEDDCPGCAYTYDGKSACPYDQHTYDLVFFENHENKELLEDTAELLERYKEIDALYLQKCEEVNKLRDLVSGKFDPDRYVEFYNNLIAKESEENADDGWQPHENI